MNSRTLGPYRLLSALGKGGMGTVWLAETAEPGFGLPAGARVAVKEIHPHLAGVEGFVRRFEREGHVGLRLRHENVVRTYGACDVTGGDGASARLLVMEVVEGQTLRAMLDELGRVPEALCRHVGRETAKGLAAIHGAGAVHRDMKPENVIVTPDNVVKVMDLGVARLKDEALRLSQTGTFVGSVLYAAPEQFLEGDEALDGRADLYALGLTLYELATGRHPFAADDLRVVMRRQIQEIPRRASEVHPPISAFFDEVLRTLLEKDPARRFPDAATLAEVLAEGEASTWWASRPAPHAEGGRRPSRRPRAPRESAMHGRAAEMERLRDAFAHARAGEGAVVLVEGEAGIGKTRLVDEWLDELARAPEAPHVLVGGHPGGGVATSAGALAGAFRAHLGGDVRDDAVRPLLVAAPLLVPGFAALLRGDAPPAGVEPLGKDAVQSAFVHAARALADARPTVILVEDLHNAPEDGLSLFLALALAATGRPLVLVGTARPGLPEPFTAALDRIPVARRVPVGRLGPRDLAALLTEALRSERLAEDLGFRVGAKSDGNPFFVFEILRALRESGRLTKTDDGSWVRTQAIREIEIPSSVRDLVQARLCGLAEEDKDLLDVAACCGDEFDPLLVGEALGIPRIPLLKRLGRLERTNRLVRSVDVRCLFDQRQVREAIYAGLSELLRREYHAALGEALVAREVAAGRSPDAADGATATAISRHLIEGAQGERALPWLERAMDHEARRGHPEGASALIQRALAVPGLLTGRRRAQASLRLSDLLETLGHVAESRPPLTEALALADADGDPVLRADVRKSLGWADLHGGRPEAGLARLVEARDLARGAGAVRSVVAALGGIGTAQRILRRHEESVATHREELDLARSTGLRDLVGTAQSHLGNALWASGRHAEAAACHQASLAVARELEEPMREATAVGNLGLCLLEDGEFDRAAAQLGRQLELTRAMGYRRGEAIAQGNLANVERSSGRLARALALEERHLALCAEIDYARGLALGLMSRIETLLLLGDPEGALEVHGRCVEACVRAGLGKLAKELDEERAQIALQLGDEATARACWARRLANVEDATDRRLAMPVHLALGRFHVRAGRATEALGHLRVAVAIARESPSTRDLVLPLAWLARIERDAVAEAVATLDGLSSHLPHLTRLEAQHVLAHATGDATRKVEAQWLLDTLVAHAPPGRQGPMVERVPLLREVRAGDDVLPA